MSLYSPSRDSRMKQGHTRRVIDHFILFFVSFSTVFRRSPGIFLNILAQFCNKSTDWVPHSINGKVLVHMS